MSAVTEWDFSTCRVSVNTYKHDLISSKFKETKQVTQIVSFIKALSFILLSISSERVWKIKFFLHLPKHSNPLPISPIARRIMGTIVLYHVCGIISGMVDPLRQIEIIEWNETLNWKSRIIALLHTLKLRAEHSDLFIWYLLLVLGNWCRALAWSMVYTKASHRNTSSSYLNWIWWNWFVDDIATELSELSRIFSHPFVLPFQLFIIHCILFLESFLHSLHLFDSCKYKSNKSNKAHGMPWVWDVRAQHLAWK